MLLEKCEHEINKISLASEIQFSKQKSSRFRKHSEKKTNLSNVRNVPFPTMFNHLQVNAFPHTTNLQQMSLKLSIHHKIENLYKWKYDFFNRVEIIVANGEIAHYEQFLLLLQWFQKSSAAEASESVYM